MAISVNILRWLVGQALRCKSAGIAYVGSNPTPATPGKRSLTRPFAAIDPKVSVRRSRQDLVAYGCSVPIASLEPGFRGAEDQQFGGAARRASTSGRGASAHPSLVGVEVDVAPAHDGSDVSAFETVGILEDCGDPKRC